MPVRRSHRVWPFVAMALLFRMQLVNFCGTPSPHRRLNTALNWWRRKSEEPSPEPVPITPVSNVDISSMDIRSVSCWLATLDLEQYVPNFEAASVNGLMLQDLTDEDLEVVGVDQPFHRKKILTHRNVLVEKGFETLSFPERWHLDRVCEASKVNDPVLEPQLFAEEVLTKMKLQGMEIGSHQEAEALVKSLDTLVVDLLEQNVYLDTLEAINLYTRSQTAQAGLGSDGSGSVRQDIQEDQLQILAAANSLQEGISATQSNIKQLAVAMLMYCKSVTPSKMSDSDKDAARSRLEETLQTWKDKMLDQGKKASICNQGFVRRTAARIMSQLPGGAAVRSNLEEFSKLREEKEQEAEKCKRIYDLADPELQLALKARKDGGLKKMIQFEEEKLRRLEKRQDSLLEKKGKLEKLKEDYRVFRSQQRNETKNIRDWHIKRWWRSMWKEEMEVYENQVTKDEEHRQADERDLDRKLEKIDDELIDISDKKEKLRDDIEELKVKDSQEFWTSKLSAEGLLAAEAEVKRKDEKLKFIQEQLLEAMKKTGVANPELAADLITQHERSSILLSETSKKSKVVAQGMQEIISQVEMTIHDSSNVMEQVASALLIIHDEHQEQMRRLKKSKPQVLKNVWESKAVFLAPLAPESPASLNRTA